MTRFRGPVLAGLCLATIAACCGFLPTASVAADDYLGVTFGFSPAKAQYYPGEDFSLEVTAVDLMPTPSISLDPLINWVKVVNVSAHFSWMALEEDGWTYVSDTSTWLAPDQEGSESGAGLGATAVHSVGVGEPARVGHATYGDDAGEKGQHGEDEEWRPEAEQVGEEPAWRRPETDREEERPLVD